MQFRPQRDATSASLSMALSCGRLDVALQPLSRSFLRRSWQWRGLTEELMWPESDDWRGSQHAGRGARLPPGGHTLHQSLQELRCLAAGRRDPSPCHLVVRNCLQPQARLLKELSDYLTNLHSLGTRSEGLVNLLFSKLSLHDGGKEN
ncbi:Ferritin heavy chain [Heterocephalus glaber]|uniref:Ferritin heavy chain n=1 Tax=Heterocephalus glaber TaxID=10181 RepID=G5B3P2_HETGA|nr:Ferritin heavy chain [Heterocephalus glaber]